MNKHCMNLGQYNNRHVIKHINLKLFVSFKKYIFNHLFNLNTLNEENVFFKFKKIFLWITLHMQYVTVQTFISLITRKKQSRNFLKSKKLSFDFIAMHKCFWPKESLLSQRNCTAKNVLHLTKQCCQMNQDFWLSQTKFS